MLNAVREVKDPQGASTRAEAFVDLARGLHFAIWEATMQSLHGVNTCRWAAPTLSLRHPLWLDAEDRPWSCLRSGEAQPMASTDVCRTCPAWTRASIAQVNGARAFLAPRDGGDHETPD